MRFIRFGQAVGPQGSECPESIRADLIAYLRSLSDNPVPFSLN